MKDLVVFRCHYIDDSIISEFKKLSDSVSDCILLFDNHNKIIDSDNKENLITLKTPEGNFNVFLIDEQILEEFNLPYYTDDPNNTDFGKVMWYNSDYPQYIVRKYFPKYDYYWLIECDVFCNGKSYKPFFKKYKHNKSDLIIKDYRPIHSDSDWWWQYKTEWCYNNTPLYGSLFPVVRISGDAIDFLYKKRLEQADLFNKVKENTDNRWIFCELFIATELTNNNFKCQDLDEPFIRYLPVYNLNKERIFEKPDFRLYHPVK